MQMEAQGYDWLLPNPFKSRELTSSSLPTTFGTTSDQPEQSHIASNIAASMANAETQTGHASELNQTPAQAPVT